jgi:hypothetical protein
MNSMHILFHLIRADFLERTRRYSFLVMLGAVMYLGFLVNDGTIGVVLGKYRGEFNTAWVGAMMSMVATFFLSWFGFFLVKNAILRDELTGVGQIIATTPLSKLEYLSGKAMSNFAVLAIMVAILIVAAVILQLVSSEASDFNLWQLLSPFILITLPALALVAALAVLFESIPILSGGFGNVVFFFGWMVMLIAGVELQNDVLDIPALHVVSTSMQNVARATFPDYSGGFVLGNSGERIVGTFQWNGVVWTERMLLIRLGWLLVAPLIILAASLFFRRFDTSRNLVTFSRQKKAVEPVDTHATHSPTVHERFRLSPIPSRFRFHKLVIAELRLMLKGKRWWWYGIGGGLILACLLAPINEARQIALPFAWIWPVLIWSSMGAREERFRTHEIVFSSPRSLQWQLPSMYTAGVLVAMIAGCGIFFRLLALTDLSGIAMWIIGALFIPAFAVATGVWSGSNRLFEVLYLAIWYVGPMNKTPELDFMGAAGIGGIPMLPVAYLLVTVALLTAARLGRERALHR